MNRLISVIGGTGFVGRTLVEHLARAGWRIRVVCRNPLHGERLRVLGDVGQIAVMAADIRRPGTLGPAVEGADAVINLVGILDEKSGQSFTEVQAEGAGHVAAAATALEVGRLVHVSAIGADAESPALYGRSKAEGEARVRAAFPAATIVRPSLVFGAEDGFTNRFAAMMALSPVVPVVAPDTRFQPVYVVDLAAALIAAVDRPGETLEIGGPEVQTMRALMEDIARLAGQRKPVLDVPAFGARAIAAFGFLPGAPLTNDQYLMLGRDNVANGALPGLSALGIAPTPMAAVAADWLDRYRQGGRFAVRQG